jgi:hypothetical protein
MKKISNYLLICTLILFSSFSNRGVAQNTCTAQAPSQVAVGQQFEYQIMVNNQASEITPINLSDFDVLGGPMVMSRTNINIVNGKTVNVSSFSYSYVLSAKKEGTFTIPATNVKVNNKILQTNPVTIKVVKGNPRQVPNNTNNNRRQPQGSSPTFNEKDIFINASTSKTNPYVGEQVIITHKLYINSNSNAKIAPVKVEIPSQNGLWSYTLGDPNSKGQLPSEVIDGKKYLVFEIRKTAVFPQKSGEITVTPLEMSLKAYISVFQSTGDPFFDQFMGGLQSSKEIPLNIKSSSIKLNVKELPTKNQPPNFNGITGNYNIKSLLSRNKLKTNDATNLTITISGSGNIQYIDHPEINFPPEFDVSDPKITDNINTKGNNVSGTRIFEYVIIPRTEGNYTIPAPSLTFFDLQSNSYKTITGTPFTIEVEKGTGSNQSTSTGNQKNIKILGKDIRYIKTKIPKFQLIQKNNIFGTPIYYSSFIILIILFISILILRRNQIEYHSNTALLKNKRAHKVAQINLKNAYQLLNLNQKDLFFIEISRALWGYVSNKYRIPLAQLSMENVEVLLKNKGISETIILSFLETLQLCEYARFAPDDNSTIMKEMYEKALAFILKNESINKNEQ